MQAESIAASGGASDRSLRGKWYAAVPMSIGLVVASLAAPTAAEAAHRAAPRSTANAERAKSLFVEVWNKQNRAAIDTYFADECVFKMGGTTTQENGPKWYRDSYDHFHAIVPDITFTTDEPVVQGDRVAIYWRGDGTDRGALLGKPPTGNHVHVEGIMIVKFNKMGKIFEYQEQWDALAMLQAAGVVDPALTTF